AGLQRAYRLVRYLAPGEPALAVTRRESGGHLVDVLRRGQQDDGRGLRRHVGAHLVDERAVLVRAAVRLGDTAGGSAEREARRQTRGPEHQADRSARERALECPLSDDVALLSGVR